MTDSTFLNQIGLGGFDLGYLLIGMAVAILLLLIFLILLIVLKLSLKQEQMQLLQKAASLADMSERARL